MENVSISVSWPVRKMMTQRRYRPQKNSGQCHLNLLNKNVVSNVMGVEKSVQDAHPFSRKKTKLFRNQKNIGL